MTSDIDMPIEIPLDIKIIKAFISSNQNKLTVSEIAVYCDSSIQAIKYHLQKTSKFLIQSNNGFTNKKHYYINDFFLNKKALTSLRDNLNPFLELFINMMEFDESVSDDEIEIATIEFLKTIAWLFVGSEELTENNFQ